MIQKLVIIVIASVLLFSNGRRIYAAVGNKGLIQREVNQNKIQLPDEVKDKAGSRPGLLRELLTKTRVAIGSGQVTAISGNILTVVSEGKTYSVVTDDKTQFRRRFWGKSSISEIVVNHTVNVIGKWTDDTKTRIQARLVRDISIQKRFGVFFGVVQSVSSSGWVMTTINDKRENQTVTVGSKTRFVSRDNKTITQADIVIGHRVRVKGLWDRVNNTVTEVIHVKDFNLPVRANDTSETDEKATLTPTPTSTPVPTATVTPTPTTIPEI